MDSIVGGETYSMSSVGQTKLTGLDLTITPISTNPKFLISLTINLSATYNVAANIYDSTGGVRILTGTAISNRDAISTGPFGSAGPIAANSYGTQGKSIMGVYTPSSNASSARNFQVYVEAINSTGDIHVGRNRDTTDARYNSYSPCFLTVMEITG